MNIWVDADACPVVVKEIIYRAAQRTQMTATFVANQGLRLPPSPYLKMVQVDKGFDVADNHIVETLSAGDLVISADIPLVAQVIEKEAHALNPRGEFYTKENIAERLAMRNLMEELRSTGIETSTQAPFSKGDSKAFAAQLDRLLAKHQ